MTDNIQRYGFPSQWILEIQEMKDGEYIKYKDHIAALEAVKADLIAVSRDRDNYYKVATDTWNALEAVKATVKPLEGIVPPHCSGSALGFDPGTLRVNKDGSGYIAINEDDFILEDDRCEGPDGPEGGVHWIVRLDASEMIALRDFLVNGALAPSPALEANQQVIETLRAALEWALNECTNSDHPHYPYKNDMGRWVYPYLVHGSPFGGGVSEASFDTALEAVEAARVLTPPTQDEVKNPRNMIIPDSVRSVGDEFTRDGVTYRVVGGISNDGEVASCLALSDIPKEPTP